MRIIRILVLTSFFLYIIISCIKYYYFDTYLMNLAGRVEAVRTDIKEQMYISVSKKEHSLMHFWPKLQRNIAVGDSVFKKPKDYDIILLKKGTNKKLVCTYEE